MAVTLAPALLWSSCGAPLPDDTVGYQDNPACFKLNKEEIPPYEGDPHKGLKNVFVCNLDLPTVQANTRPFPDGTLVVKESRREGETFTWLVATARKTKGIWQWNEYTRNFANEDHQRLLVKERTCTNCHQKAQAQDFICTLNDSP